MNHEELKSLVNSLSVEGSMALVLHEAINGERVENALSEALGYLQKSIMTGPEEKKLLTEISSLMKGISDQRKAAVEKAFKVPFEAIKQDKVAVAYMYVRLSSELSDYYAKTGQR